MIKRVQQIIRKSMINVGSNKPFRENELYVPLVISVMVSEDCFHTNPLAFQFRHTECSIKQYKIKIMIWIWLWSIQEQRHIHVAALLPGCRQAFIVGSRAESWIHGRLCFLHGPRPCTLCGALEGPSDAYDNHNSLLQSWLHRTWETTGWIAIVRGLWTQVSIFWNDFSLFDCGTGQMIKITTAWGFWTKVKEWIILS